MSSKSVIVIGGGLAGLAAAIALAESGSRVRLFEKRPFLGGRATSYLLPNGQHVDNCQHVTLGCCTNLDDFYRRIGAAAKIRSFDQLVFVDPQGRRGVIQSSLLPAPLHLSSSFAFFPLLGSADKRAIAQAMLEIVRSGGHPPDLDEPNGISMLEWLRRRKQTAPAIERFWRVVLVSALNEELHCTDARFGIDVFWKAFLANRAGYRIGVPCVPLADLYDGCRAAIEQRGGEVRLRAPVRRLLVEGNSIRAVQFDDGREEAAPCYILAVPHDAVSELLPENVASREPAFVGLANLRASPITGVHFWFDRVVLREPFLSLLDCTSQWVFNKSLLYGSSDTGQYLQIVISASYDLLGKSRQEIIDLCLRELEAFLPAARDAELLQATVIKEASATFSPAPGCDRWRPSQKSPISNLFLAGDWTATGWPATMEGAVRSGYLAAEAILASGASSRRFLQPDLPVAPLARWLSRG
jgi:zeta-carotene desaturase